MTCSLSDIRISSCTEPDTKRRFLLNMENAGSRTAMLELTSAGLVSVASGCPDIRSWRFPAPSKADFSDKGVTSNLMTEATTLYVGVKKDSVYDRVSVQQSMVVEKSLEKRAEEAAAMIFALRDQRLKIITGDTDASYDGEAMGAALAEIARLEDEYMTLFTGYSETRSQKMTFDIVPEKERDSQLYVAFRISETEGLVPADNISGKPVILEVTPQTVAPSLPEGGKVSKKARDNEFVTYRIPAICTVKLSDGMNVIFQSRVPVYQLGTESSFPLNMDMD